MPVRLASIITAVTVAAALFAAESGHTQNATPRASGATASASSAPAQRAPAPAPVSPAVSWRRAVDAWDAGQYPDALRDLMSIMRSPAAAEYRDRVALLTGELFTTTELTTDGRNPRIAPNGLYVSYETGPTARTVTRLVHLGSGVPRVVAEVAGASAAFDRSSARVAYLRPAATPEWTSANEALEAARTTQERQSAQALVNLLLGKGDLVVRDLASEAEHTIPTSGLLKSAPMFSSDGQRVLFIGADEKDLTRTDVFVAGDSGMPTRITDEPGYKTNLIVDPTGAALVYTVTATAPFRPPGQASGGRGAGGGGAGATGGPAPAPNPCGGGAGGRGGGTPQFGIVDLSTKTTRVVVGSTVAMSADGGTIAWLSRNNDTCALDVSPTLTDSVTTLRTGRERLDAPALSPDGQLVAYQLMPFTDWEIYVSDRAAGTHRRITHEIQHDVLPHFLTRDTLLGLVGEPRHRRSYLYDVATAARTRIFANNTIRTISPEYIWLPSADGTRVLIQADRDGDTISPERGVYVVDLTRRVTVADVTARVSRQQADEADLRQRMTKAYQPIADRVRAITAQMSTTRIYEYEKALGDFDSKSISRPGNAKAIDYLTATYASFGYTPDQQWFQPPPAAGNKTANVIATLKGTENPDLIYVVGSHFDSVPAGPGADDDTSGTCVLLETARALHDTPLPATVIFASFTGEEAGDLGSREFVRLAAQAKWRVAGALNNDMIGWSGESARMDNTIRYSNAGIRDLQHGAAFLFSNLITYDAKYYKSTDAAAFFEGWGDIVGGLGSYPVLGNPNYHQPTDTIETVNFQQVAETAKVTAATIIYLASSPSRLRDLTATKTAAGVELTWTPSPEKSVTRYIVAYGPASDPLRTRVTVASARTTLPSLQAGTEIVVKAVNSRGLEGWDWARTVVQ